MATRKKAVDAAEVNKKEEAAVVTAEDAQDGAEREEREITQIGRASCRERV